MSYHSEGNPDGKHSGIRASGKNNQSDFGEWKKARKMI